MRLTEYCFNEDGEEVARAVMGLRNLKMLELYPRYKVSYGTCMGRQAAEKCDRYKHYVVRDVLKVIPEGCTLQLNVAYGGEKLAEIAKKDTRLKLRRM